jgi:E3 ubiquitin-protein ligase TRIP12
VTWLQVRISRKRILESAIKVMESYAGNRTVIELEYFNEAGTGLGPTLEFYTLLSHELQKKGLGMWRFDDAASEKAAGILSLRATVSFPISPTVYLLPPSSKF